MNVRKPANFFRRSRYHTFQQRFQTLLYAPTAPVETGAVIAYTLRAAPRVRSSRFPVSG